MRVFIVIVESIGVLFANLLAWQIWLMLFSRGAHGTGFYRSYAPTFVLTGVLFVTFGLYLAKR